MDGVLQEYGCRRLAEDIIEVLLNLKGERCVCMTDKALFDPSVRGWQ
jgi:hypothetical protein